MGAQSAGANGDPAGHELMVVDPALKADVAIEIGGRVLLAEAFQMRRLRDGSGVLAPAPVGVADHAHAARAPGLRRDPLDEVVAVGALVLVEPPPLALRAARAAPLRDHVHVALGHVERRGARFDRMAPLRGFSLDFLQIGRQRQQRRVAALGLRQVDVHREPNAVAHRDVDILDDPDPGCGGRRLHQGFGVEGGDGRCAVACHGRVPEMDDAAAREFARPSPLSAILDRSRSAARCAPAIHRASRPAAAAKSAGYDERIATAAAGGRMRAWLTPHSNST